MPNTTQTVFLSYALADRDFASTIQTALARFGFRTFDPEVELRLGEKIDEKIMDGIRAADVFVFVVPEHGTGINALVELGAARALGKRIVALARDRKRAASSDVAVRLSNLMVLDAGGIAPSLIAEQVLAVAKPELAAN